MQGVIPVAVILGLCLTTPSPSDTAVTPPPNLLVILADDLGWDDLALHGNLHAHTPRLDALGRESMRLDDFTVNPVCAPSRATLLTGRHFLRTGVSHVHGGKDFLHRGERTLADRLRAAGYATGMWGKWHLGAEAGYQPWERGFDEAWSADLYRHRQASGLLNGTPTTADAWADAHAVDLAAAFIERHRDRPFFAYVAPLAPHLPLEAPDAWVAPHLEAGLPEAQAKLWGMVGHLDHQVGRLLDTLERLDLARNTIVVFLSDNGADCNRVEAAARAIPPDRASADRGWKGDLYQGGVRVPCFVRWPGRLPARRVESPLGLVDLSPTLLDLLGVRDDGAGPPFDGESFRETLATPGPVAEPAPIVNYAHPGWLTSGPPYSLAGLPGEYAPVDPAQVATLPFGTQSLSLRRGKLKLLLNPDFTGAPGQEHVRLVDLAVDPGETTDLSAQRPEDRDRLLADLQDWWAGVVREPHAFRAPVVFLRPGRQQVSARLPARIDGSLVNTVIDLRGWSGPGDGATYQVELGGAATLSIEFDWRIPPPTGMRFRVVAPGSPSSGETDGHAAVGLSLEAGIHELRVEVLAAPATPPAEPPALRRLVIDLTPR